MKKLVAIVLVAVMAVSLVPLTVGAAEVNESVNDGLTIVSSESGDVFNPENVIEEVDFGSLTQAGEFDFGSLSEVEKIKFDFGDLAENGEINYGFGSSDEISFNFQAIGGQAGVNSSNITVLDKETVNNKPFPLTYKKKVGVAKIILDGVSLIVYDNAEKIIYEYGAPNDGIPGSIIEVPNIGSTVISVALICEGYKTVIFDMLLRSDNTWALANPELDKEKFGNHVVSMAQRVPYLEVVFEPGVSEIPAFGDTVDDETPPEAIIYPSASTPIIPDAEPTITQ